MTSLQTGFSESDFSWDAYEAYRPAYPRSMWDRILEYHSDHHPHFDAAHDIGTGSGVGAAELAQHFARVYVSDPAAHNLEAARANLTSERFRKSLTKPCAFEFAQRLGEDSWIPDASLDMVTMFEAIHWADGEKVVGRMAQTLKSGGTMALAYYGARPYIEGNMEADDIWAQVVAERLQAVGETIAANHRGMLQAAVGLDHVPVVASLYCEGVKRVYLNVEESGNRSFGDWRITKPGPEILRVGSKDVIERIEDVTGWSKEVDASWFPGYLNTLQVAYEDLPEYSFAKTAMGRLQQLVAGDKVRVVWPVEILLATRI